MSLVAVARTKFVAGVDAPGHRGLTYDWRAELGAEANTAKIAPTLEVHDLGNALAEAWATDAHLVTYVLRERGAPLLRQPRINKNALPWIREQGYELGAEVLVADVDNPGHVAWTPELRTTFAGLMSRSPILHTAGVYLTTNGARVVQPLSHALPVERFEIVLRTWLMALEASGIAVDFKCADWPRMFRLPRVRRDGRAQRLELFLERMRPIEPPATTSPGRAGGRAATRGKPRLEGVVAVVRELPPTWVDKVGKLAEPIRLGGYRGQRHELFLALAGALLGRRVPPEFVPAIVEAVARASGAADVAPKVRAAEDSVHKWASGFALKGVRWLRQYAPDVLDALDRVTDAGAARAAAQAAPEPDKPLAVVTADLEDVIRRAGDGVTLVKAQCGLGKSYAARVVALERARKTHASPGEHTRAPLGSKTALVVPTTRLALEHTHYVAEGGVDVVRFFGVLSVVDEQREPVCQYAAAGRPLAAGGQSIPWEFCEGRGQDPCNLRETCRAYGGREGAKTARVAIGPHSMLAELDKWCGSTGLLVIDEPPPLLVTEVLRLEDLRDAREKLVRFEPRYAAAMAPALSAVAGWFEHIVELDYVGPLDAAFACGVDQELEAAAFEATGAQTAKDAARSAFKPDHKGSFAPPLKRAELAVARSLPSYAAALGAASRVLRALWRCLNIDEAIVRVEERGKAEEGKSKPRALICTWPDEQLRDALRREGAVALLDAGADLHAPVVAKVVGYAPPLHVFAAPDGAPVARVLHRTSAATRTALMPNGRVDPDRVVAQMRVVVDWLLEAPGPAGIITFLPLELALRAALGEDVRGEWHKRGQRLVALEALRAALGPELERLPEPPRLGHFGAMRGLDAWKELDALATLGDPWANLGDIQYEVDFLGLAEGWEARAEDQARAELEQAHGRLRTVHRTRPARQLHVGALVPGGWSTWSTRRPVEGRPRGAPAVGPDELRHLVARVGGTTRSAEVLGATRTTVKRYLSGERGIPPNAVEALRSHIGLVPDAVDHPQVAPKPLLEITPNSGFGATQETDSVRSPTNGTDRALVVSVPPTTGGDPEEPTDPDDDPGGEPSSAPRGDAAGPRTRPAMVPATKRRTTEEPTSAWRGRAAA